MNTGLKIKDISIEDIQSGKNWVLCDSNELLEFEEGLKLEELHIKEQNQFKSEDVIVYSAIFVTDDGLVNPLVLIKPVEEIDYGGDYCEIHNGKWRQLGLVANPNAPYGKEFIANPLSIDPSFDTLDNENDDYRLHHREGFSKWASSIKST